MRKLLLILLLLIVAGPTCLAGEYLCRKISLEKGLSHSNVTAITRDRRGFLWIGTRFGLNRYDFEQVRNYYHDPADPTSLPDNNIRVLYTDSHGQLWICGESNTALYKPSDDSFSTVQVDGVNGAAEARSFLEEGEGLLIGGHGGIYYHDYNTGTTTLLQTKGGSRYMYTAILRRNANYYVLATRWDGLWLFDRAHATITRLPGIDHRHVMATTIGADGALYLSPYGRGLHVYGRTGELLYCLDSSNSELPNNIILDIREHDGRLWIATDGGGIAIYNPATRTFERSVTNSALGELGSVTTLYTDSYANMYAGTVRDGAVTVLPVAVRSCLNSREQGYCTVSAFEPDADGTIWVGTDGAGIMHYKPRTHEFVQVASTAGLKVTDISQHGPDKLLVSSFDHGFYLLDKRTHALQTPPEALRGLWEKKAQSAQVIRTRMLSPTLLAIISDNIMLYNPVDGSLATPPSPARNSGISEGAITPIHNHAGRLLCHGKDYISDFDPGTGAHDVLIRTDEDIECAAYDGRGLLYVAVGKKVLCYDTATGTTEEVEGLNERVSAIVCDNDERVWFATTRALYMLRPTTGALLALGSYDGVKPNEYQPNACLATDDMVLLGGVYGMLRVDTDEISGLLETNTDPRMNLADITLNGENAYAQVVDGVLTVPYKFSGLALSVIDNGGNSQRRQHFRFIIRGTEPERVIETAVRHLDMSFLKAGEKYDVLTSCMRPDGTWTSPHQLVRVAVMAPWYKSSWMWGIMAACFILSVIWWDYKRSRRRKDVVSQQLETYRHDALEREVAFMVNTNYALRNPLTLIYAPLKLALQKLRQGENPDAILHDLECVYVNTKKMRDTIDMALDLHKVNEDKTVTTAELTTHDVNRSVDDALTAMQGDMDVQRIRYSYEHAQDMYPAVYDRVRVGSVLGIILHNALQRSTENSVIEVSTKQTADIIRVEVRDAGEYLDADSLEQMFNKYYYDDNTKFGNSLAFAYAKNIMELQGGSIGVENNADGPGITVWIELPAATGNVAEAYTRRRRNENAQATPAVVEPVVVDVDTSAMTAIVVEDDNDLCMFIASQLSAYFGKVMHAFNGKDALLLIRQYQPDIVITSLRLPVMNGLELCQAVKKAPETSHIPVILLTALKEGSTLENAYEAGADSYLSKPFDLNILMARCRNILHTRSVIRKRYTQQVAVETPERALTNADETFLLKINRLIAENIANSDFGVDTLVEKMATSRSALYTKFKDITGQTIGAYISECRFNRAKQLLADPSLTINEISDMLGFSSQRYFSTFFKERSGMSPTAFRKG